MARAVVKLVPPSPEWGSRLLGGPRTPPMSPAHSPRPCGPGSGPGSGGRWVGRAGGEGGLGKPAQGTISREQRRPGRLI